MMKHLNGVNVISVCQTLNTTLCIRKSADLLGFLHFTRFTRYVQKLSSAQQLCNWKCTVD